MQPRLVLALTFLSITCTACQSNPLAGFFGSSSSNTQTTTTTINQPGTTATNSPNTLPPTQIYDLQTNTSTGIVMRLKQISFADDSIIANLEIINGYTEIIELNSQDDMLLFDDYNNQYRLSVSGNNPTIQIQPATTVKGQFVFMGRLSPNANKLAIVTNWKNTYTAKRPHMRIDNIFIRRHPPK